jgi:transposase
MLAAQYGEHSKRAFRYKELAHRKELATEAKRQFDQQLTQQRQMHESQMAADYNTGRRGKSVLGGMFGK